MLNNNLKNDANCNIDIEAYANYLVNWLEEQRLQFYRADGYVLGLSGGIDSAVVLHLLKKTNAKLRVYLLPANDSCQQDLQDAKLILENVDLEGEIIEISPVFLSLQQQLKENLHHDKNRPEVLDGNIKARLRMIFLFTLAQSYRSIVVGTDNAAEWHTGYFTKFGDGAVDVAPLLNLRKEQVYQLAAVLGVPARIIDKKPSAGLWQGQNDEDELGIKYSELDAHLRGEEIAASSLEKINFWHQRSWHKRILAPTPLAPQQYFKKQNS